MAVNELQVPSEFIKQNAKYAKRKNRIKKGGPYSKNDKDKRMNEVYRLHFEYGYSARKIAYMMKVNRNTINGDINYWFRQTAKNVNRFYPEKMIVECIIRMESQSTRLREQLDKAKNNSERMAVERLIYDVNSKIMYAYEKMAQSSYTVNKIATNWLNHFMQKAKKSNRYMSFFDTISVSDKAHEKINMIIKEDKNRWSNKQF